jgi:hypothetical protein
VGLEILQRLPVESLQGADQGRPAVAPDLDRLAVEVESEAVGLKSQVLEARAAQGRMRRDHPGD